MILQKVKYLSIFQISQCNKEISNNSKKKEKKEEIKGVVYEIPCQKCEKSCIGETGRTL